MWCGLNRKYYDYYGDRFELLHFFFIQIFKKRCNEIKIKFFKVLICSKSIHTRNVNLILRNNKLNPGQRHEDVRKEKNIVENK